MSPLSAFDPQAQSAGASPQAPVRKHRSHFAAPLRSSSHCLTVAGRRWLGSGHELRRVCCDARVIAIAIAFIAIAIALCAAAVLGLLGIGQLALSGSAALERDGLARGQRAPAWSLTDSAGVTRTSPPACPLQLIMFADHSLKSFPSVVAGLRALRARAGPGDRRPDPQAKPGARPGCLPSLASTAFRCWPARLRSTPTTTSGSMPFAIFVDSAGLVRASSLVNHDWQVAKLSQVAAIPPEADRTRREAGGSAGSLRAVV